MVSEKALQRKLQFQEKKTHAGGIKSLINKNKNRKMRVHFTETGDIVSVSNNTNDTLNGLFHTDFTKEQLSIFESKSISSFKIARDPDIEGVFYIEEKELTIQTVSVNDFLVEVDNISIHDPDINIVVDKFYFKISISKHCLDNYTAKSTSKATANGKTYLDFYITLKGNPHFLIEHIRVKFSDLVEKHTITEVLDQEHTGQYSVYTKKALDKYRLTVL